MTLLPIKLTVIHAQGGARGDFLAGWLGTLPEYLENYWTLDCETGQSFTNAKFLKLFPPTPKETDLEKFFAGYNFILDESAKTCVSASVHRPDIVSFFPAQKKNCITLISIKVPEESALEIQWNFFVKTYLTKHRYDYSISNNIIYGVDHYIEDRADITDQIRLKKIDDHFQKLKNISISGPISEKDAVVLDYQKVFVPGGSRVVAEKLSMSCSQRHHELWDKNIDFSRPPDVIERFGRVFRFRDFQDIFQNQTGFRP